MAIAGAVDLEEFVHVGGASTSQVWPRMYREQLRSHLRFIAKHDGMRQAEQARRLLTLAMEIRSIVFGLVRRPARRSLSRDAARWLQSTELAALLAVGFMVLAAGLGPVLESRGIGLDPAAGAVRSGVTRWAVASNAPVLTPPTISNCGRRPLSRQPMRKPAPKAPFWPPPERDRRFNACPRLRSR